MALNGQALQQIQVENVIDYAQYISQVANLDSGLQGLQGIHGLQALPDGTTVAFIDSSVFDPSQLFDSGAIEVHQALPDGTVDLQQCHQVILEPPVIEQIGIHAASLEVLDVKPPIGKGPFNCTLCDKVFNKWNQLQRHLKTHDEDKPFRCNQCPASYNIQDNLLLHMATHVGPDRDPVCPECGKKFSRVASLKAHIMVHEKEENLMCAVCGDEFSVQHQLDRHMQEHRQETDGVRTYQCRQCSQEYSKMSALKEHMKQHYKVKASLHHRNYKRNIDRSGFYHKCKHCEKTFQKPSQLERHERIHTGERPFKCYMCLKTFNQKGALQMHMTKHTGARPHTCTFCPMTFAQKGNLRSHIQRVHTLSKEEHGMIFECEECSCMFRRLGSLNAHISRAHADPGESNQATVQDIKVPLQHSLHHLTDVSESSVMQDVLGLDHVGGGNDLTGASPVDGQVIHDQTASDILQQALENSGLQGTVVDDQDTYSKDVGATSASIGKSSSAGTHTVRGHLSRLGTMAVHDAATGLLKRHYIRKVNGIRWHQCTYCTKEFKKPSDLVRHIRIHTHEKPYKCTQCFRAFAVKSTLTAHIKTHTGLKEFRCDVCSKMFSTQGSLKVHLRLHTGAKPFSCTHCDKKFRTLTHCKAHNQSHLKDPDSTPRTRRALKRETHHDALLTDIPLQEPILITDTGLIQQPPRSSMFPPFASESGNPERPYKCIHCRRGFKKSSHLKQHVRSHTGEKPFRCNLCQRSFVSSGVLKAHSRTHSGEKSHKCLVCDAMFTTGGSLKRHMSTHSEVRPFMCPYCQKTFKTSVNCKKHMKTHRHELAMQHYQTEKEGEGAGVATDGGEGRGEDDGEIVEVDGLTGSETLADFNVLHEQVIGHTTTVSQPDLQVVEMNQSDLQSSGVTAESLALDTSLQQAFGQGIFGSNFTLVNQQRLLELTGQGTVQVGPAGDKSSGDDITRVTVQLEGQLDSQTSSSLPQSISGQVTSQFTYQPQSWKSNFDNAAALSTSFEQQQATTIHVADDCHSSPPENQEDEDNEGEEGVDDGREEEDSVRETQQQQLAHISTTTSSIGRRGFRCHICSKIFKRSIHLSQHMKIHNTDKSFPCPECSKPFSSVVFLKTHLSTHAGVKAHMCSLCSAAFSTAVSLRRHMLQHNSAKNYVCELCNQQFKNSAQLRRHWSLKECQGPIIDLITKTNDENQAPKRPSRRRSLGQQQLVSHEQVSISEKILMESASEKDRISMPKDIQNQTIRRGRFANMCNHCPKSFKKPSDLLRHLRIHTGEKPFICEICHRSFTVKSTLDSHMRTHKTAEKMFLCHVCNSMFSTKGSLKVHMRLHTGAKPFKCIHCDLRFRTSGHRKSHMISHFKPEGVTKKKMTKTPSQPLISSSQDNNVPPQMFILTSSQQNTAANSSAANQVVGLEQALGGQVVDQSLTNQVISVDQSLLQGQAIMPVQLTVSDGTAGDGTGLPTQVLQGLDGSIQFHFSAPIGQLGQGFQLASLDSGMIQPALQVDANLLQQLQQTGFITISPGNIQQTLTADLSQVGADISQGAVMVSSALTSTENLLSQAVSSGDAIAGQQPAQETEGAAGTETVICQTMGASDSLISQIHNTEALLLHSVQGRPAGMSHHVDIKSLPLETSAQVIGSHRLTDALLSQQSARIHVSGGVTSSVIGQATHSSQDSYQSQGVTQTSDSLIGRDRIMTTSMSDALIGQRRSYEDSIAETKFVHSLVQGMHLQTGSISEAVNPNIIVQSMSAIQGHQGGKSPGVDQGNTTLITQDGQRVTVNVFAGSAQDLGLVKISEVDEDDQKFTIPGEDSRMVSITHLDQNPSMGHHGSPLDDEVEDDNNEEVDTSALIPTADVVSLERQQEGSNRQHICGICYKGFKRAAHLREHMNIHEPGPVLKKPKATPHKCNVCDKAFQKPSQVERHMRIHTGERPFSCHICNKAFNQKNALQVHLRKHSGEKPHICPYCSSSFVQSGNLKTHIKRAHHTDMVNTMNLARATSETAGSAEQEVGGHGVPTGLDEAQSGMGGEVNVGTVGGMEHDGMDLVEVVDLFVQ